MKTKKKKGPVVSKKAKPSESAETQEPDPEWEHLEERYSQIGSDMRKLAELLGK